MIFGAMSNSDSIWRHILIPDKTMNGEKYMELLKEMLPKLLHIHRRTIFMHDGDPSHRSKSYLPDDGNGDLKPIKNLWELMKRKITDKAAVKR